MNRSVRLVLILALAACQAPVQQELAELTWSHKETITFNLGALEIVTATQSPLSASHVGHLFPITPLQAAKDWGQDRLAVTGNTPGTLRYTILTAEATEQALDVDQNLVDYFIDEQGMRYDVRITVGMTVQKEDTQSHLQATATLWRTVAQSASQAEREQVWFEMIETVMQDLNRRLEAGIADELAPYLVTP